MIRRVSVLLAAILVTLIGATPAWTCDPGEKGARRSRSCRSSSCGTTQVSPDGWGFPRSAEVCTYNAECYPWRSANGEFLLFGSINLSGPARPGHQGMWDIYISRWNSENERWGEPLNPGPVINTGMSEHRPSCTANCDTLYFDRNDDIYMSTWNGSQWSEACSLPPPVSLRAMDRHPAISSDSRRLYFTSNRDGGEGGLDIWVALWNGTSWDSVVNLGPPINSPNEETRPFESFDGQRLYFSNNHGVPRPGGSFGGPGDIYVSRWTGRGWGPIELVPAPINNDLVACSPCESPDGSELWIGSEAWEGGRGDEDIWVSTRGVSPPPHATHGYGDWIKAGELPNAIYVYDLKEDAYGTIYAATACADSTPTGRVFRTADGGSTWIPCAPLPGAMVVYSLLVDADTVYAGTYPLGDVFKSTDHGNSWVMTGELPAVTAARSLARLQNGELWVGTSPYDTMMRNRIYRTEDGGSTWSLVVALPRLNPCKFIYQVTGGDVFVGGWGIDSDAIIYRSSDNGATWDSLTIIPQWECEFSADCFYETNDGTLYVTGWIPSQSPGFGGGYVYRSTDNGTNWLECSKIMRGDGVHNGRTYAVVEDLRGDIYVGMQPAPDSVVYRSSDGGDTWHSTGGLDGSFECLCLLRTAEGSIYAGTTPNGDVFRYAPQVGIDESGVALRSECRLFPNCPSPPGVATTVRFQLPNGGKVAIDIYDILGRRLRTLLDGDVTAGWHHVDFDGRDGEGRKLANGIYVCHMKTEDAVCAQKMVFLE